MKRRWERVGWVLSALCVAAALGFPGCAHAQGPSLRITGALSSSQQVRGAAVTADGVWLATGGGVVRVSKDGAVRPFGVADGLPSFDVFAVVPAADGALWVATDRGTARWTPGTAAKPVTTVGAVALASDGTGGAYVVQADQTFVHLTARGTERVPVTFPGTTYALIYDAPRLYFGTSHGLRVWDGRGTRTVRDARATDLGLSFTNDSGVITAHTPTADLILRAGQVHKRTAPTSGVETPFGHLAWDRQGATLAGKTLALGSLPDNHITAVVPYDGGIALGTFDGGLVLRAQDGAQRVLTEASGLLDHRINALTVWRGALWSAHDRGLCRVSDTIQCFRAGAGPAAGHATALLATKDALYAGSSRGLTRFDGTAWHAVPLPLSRITALATNTEGDLWVGTAEGLLRLHHDTVLERRTVASRGLHDDWVTALATTASGDLWIGSYSRGLARLDAQGALHLEDASAWVNPSALLPFASTILYGGLGEGLRMAGGTAPMLPTADITALGTDGRFLWVGTRVGVFTLEKQPRS